MENIVKNVLTLFVFIFAIERRFVFCVNITWTKYESSGKTNGRCIRNETASEAEVRDPGACGIMCHINSVCESFIFKPDTRECTGCRYKHDDMPGLENEHTGSEPVSYSKPGILESDCLEILHNRPDAESGPYLITLWKSKKTLQVFCDMSHRGGGWTVFQNRYDSKVQNGFDGNVSFNRNFSEYENGFGKIHGEFDEFWLGLKYIKEIADQGYTNILLDVDQYYRTGSNSKAEESRSEEYRGFGIQGRNYKLTMGTDPPVVSRGSLRVGPPSFGFVNSRLKEFSTFDNDNDKVSDRNCAAENNAGWWYDDDCGPVNLNGAYPENEQAAFTVEETRSRMMMRRSHIKPGK